MKIGFIGAGRMATALAAGIARNMSGSKLIAFDPRVKACQELSKMVGEKGVQFEIATGNTELIASTDIVVLAVKPQVVAEALATVSARDPQQLFVSVIAGTRISKLAELLQTQNIVRAMPNTPCLIGAGATAYCKAAGVSQASMEVVAEIFESVGQAVEVSESQMDAVTGLSGSGPAYVYTFIESLIDAGLQVGLTRDVARALAVQTVAGATAMVQQSGEQPAILRDQVTSPGGTTLHGLRQLEKTGLRESVLAGVRAAMNRSVELSEGG